MPETRANRKGDERAAAASSTLPAVAEWTPCEKESQTVSAAP